MNHKQKRRNKENAFDEQEIIDIEEIGKLFKKFRKVINKAQHKLAPELNIGQGVISNIERGKCYPNFKHLNYLYKKYGLNIKWIFSGKGKMFILKLLALIQKIIKRHMSVFLVFKKKFFQCLANM